MGCFGRLNTPEIFSKNNAQKCTLKLIIMTIGSKQKLLPGDVFMYRLGNAPKSFCPGLCLGPHWGSLQRSPDPYSWWGLGWPPVPKNPTPPWPFGLRATAMRASLSRSPNTPKNK